MMMPIPDLSGVDTSTTVGQVTFFLVALALFLNALRQNFKFSVGKPMQRSYRTLRRENEVLRIDIKYYKNGYLILRDWQLQANILIFILRNMVATGVRDESDEVTRIIEKLKQLDSELSELGEDDGEDS